MHPRYCVVLSRRRQNPLVPQGYQTAVLGDAIGKGCHIGHIGQGLAQQVGVYKGVGIAVDPQRAALGRIPQCDDQLFPGGQCPLPLQEDIVLIQLPDGYAVLPRDGVHRVSRLDGMDLIRQQHHQGLPRHQCPILRHFVLFLQQTGGHAVLPRDGEKGLSLFHHMNLHLASSSRLPRSTQSVYAPHPANRRHRPPSSRIQWGNICSKGDTV